jgi:hypothetical protein
MGTSQANIVAGGTWGSFGTVKAASERGCPVLSTLDFGHVAVLPLADAQ